MPGGVIDGQAVNQAITNAAFLYANGDTTGVGIVTLNNTTAASSGPQVDNVQGAINTLIDGVGGGQSTPATAYGPLPSNLFTNASTHEQALGILARLFQAATGHAHTGVDGDGPLITNVVQSIAASGGSPLTGNIILAASGGATVTEIGNTILITAGGGGGGSGAGTILVQEVPTGVANGINTDFYLSASAASASSICVFVDRGPQVYGTAFGATGNLVRFNPGYIPAPGQDVYAIYPVFSNVAAPSGIEVHGSKSSPVSISASAGIIPTGSVDQIWWVKCTGGGTVTANPAIAAGYIGQRLTVYGTSLTDYLKIPDSAGTDQNGDVTLDNNQAITYYFDGTDWSEASRRR